MGFRFVRLTNQELAQVTDDFTTSLESGAAVGRRGNYVILSDRPRPEKRPLAWQIVKV